MACLPGRFLSRKLNFVPCGCVTESRGGSLLINIYHELPRERWGAVSVVDDMTGDAETLRGRLGASGAHEGP